MNREEVMSGTAVKAVTIVDHGNPLVPASEGAAVIHMIERAARDPSVDLDKLERLIAMRQQIKAQEAKDAFDRAMMAAQGDMRPICADASNPQTKSRYASFAQLDRALRPIYTRNGFSLTFDTADGAAVDHLRVVCDVSAHGHTRRHHIDMPADGKGAKGGDVMTKTHATGSALTYGRRYLLQMIFNIAVGDDDGNGAAGGTITDQQVETLTAAVTEAGADIHKFLAWLKVESISDIPARDYDRAMRALETRRAKQ